MKRTLAVDLGAGLTLPTPVLVAAGCAGTGRELAGLVDLRRVGGLVSRSITLEPRKGSPPPRIAETPSGTVWSTGLQNPGVAAFVDDELPRLAKGGPPVSLGVRTGDLRPALGGVAGWMSGPALKPLTLRAVFEASRSVPEAPIVAVGGVRTPVDAVEMLLAGASAVQVGTAGLLGPF